VSNPRGLYIRLFKTNVTQRIARNVNIDRKIHRQKLTMKYTMPSLKFDWQKLGQ